MFQTKKRVAGKDQIVCDGCSVHQITQYAIARFPIKTEKNSMIFP